ncbi:hypothetical protein [Streptomyces indiaensis]|nr:hypothetical protein [Streptomyces indiaensis]
MRYSACTATPETPLTSMGWTVLSSAPGPLLLRQLVPFLGLR